LKKNVMNKNKKHIQNLTSSHHHTDHSQDSAGI